MLPTRDPFSMREKRFCSTPTLIFPQVRRPAGIIPRLAAGKLFHIHSRFPQRSRSTYQLSAQLTEERPAPYETDPSIQLQGAESLQHSRHFRTKAPCFLIGGRETFSAQPSAGVIPVPSIRRSPRDAHQ